MRLWTCARPFTPQTPICRVLRSGGAGAVPVRVPDTDVPEAQPAPGAARRISQAAASRAFTAYTPLIAQILQEHVPTVGDFDPTAQLIVDGTLLECWSWKNHPEFDLTQAQDHRTQRPGHLHPPSGHLAWVSDPQYGCVHDTEALHRSSLLDIPATDLPPGAGPPSHISDKGYIGLDMITPKRKPPNLHLHPDDKTYNRAVDQVRYKIERVIANFKTWRILHTGYRRPLQTSPTTRGSARSVGGCLIFSGSGVSVRARRDPHGDDEGVYSIPSPARSRRHVIFHDDRPVAPASIFRCLVEWVWVALLPVSWG